MVSEQFGLLRFAASHPFHDETVERMGHPQGGGRLKGGPPAFKRSRAGAPGLGFETWETTNLLRADSERLLHAMLFFLFFHWPFGVGQDFFGY